jgi:hypothetical protein
LHIGLHHLREPIGAQADVSPVGPDVDPFDQQLNDTRLLSWEQFVPERIETAQRRGNLGFGERIQQALSGAPGPHDHLR